MQPGDACRLNLAEFLGKHLRQLDDLGSRQTYDRHQAIYLMGDPADALFLVESGSVKVGVISDEGKEKTLYLSGPGQFFGELCICGVAQHPDQTVALESSTVDSFSLENVTALLAQRPELVEDFLQLICGRLLDARITQFLSPTIRCLDVWRRSSFVSRARAPTGRSNRPSASN